MFCPKCGNTMEESQETCSKCGFEIASLKQEPYNLNAGTIQNEHLKNDFSDSAISKNNTIKLMIFSIIAIVVLIMFFNAASSIAKGGLGIMDIQSVGGKTLEEAYYSELGSIYAGYANFVRAFGVVCASVLVGLGLK